MSATLRALQKRKTAAVVQMRGITDLAASEGRDLTADEDKQFSELQASVETINKSISREEALKEAEAQLDSGHTTPLITVSENIEKDPKRGWANAGDYFQAVVQAALPEGRTDRRLIIGTDGINAAAPSTFGGEGVGQDGGFSIPPQFSDEIFTLSLEENSFLPLTDNLEISSNSMVLPKDETTPWGTDGVRAYWQGEATAATATKPKLGETAMRMKKLMALVPMSDELIADGTALMKYLPKKVADSIRWKYNESVLFGTGAGTPLGCLIAGQGALVTIAKESAQPTLTLTTANVAKMVAALPEGSYQRAVWIINNDVLPSLFTMTLGNYPIYLPAGGSVGGVQMSPFGTLLGRPIIVSQHANTFSSAGDVNLVDFDYYQSITKAGGMETATSMHLYFDAAATAFRTIFRVDGMPKILNAISPAKGSNKLSPFVSLGAR